MSPLPDEVSGAQSCEVTWPQSLSQCQQWNPNPELSDFRVHALPAKSCLLTLAFEILEEKKELLVFLHAQRPSSPIVLHLVAKAGDLAASRPGS